MSRKGAGTSALDDPKHKAAVAKFKEVDHAKAMEATGAIAILEKRAFAPSAEITLEGGDAIPIRTRLSRPEKREVDRLFEAVRTAIDGGDPDAANEASYQLLSHMIYVEDRTPDEIAEWLRANPDRIADADGAEIIIRYNRAVEEDHRRRAHLIESFRDQ